MGGVPQMIVPGDARITGHTVELVHRDQRVAAHVCSTQKEAFTTVDKHMPAAHRAHRLEVACALALSLHSCNYRTVRDILTNGRDRLAPSVGADWVSPQHEHLRGARSYH